jgi:hypothetical protein
MDFNQLLSRMKELDQPAAQEMPVAECGPDMMPQQGMAPAMNDQPPPAHPSMSVNLNAQGMDNIESLLKLMTKVNPDMINQPAGMTPPMPSMTVMPSITPPGPSISSIGDLGNLDAGPLKMLPDLDKDEPSMGDVDGDGDHDMDDHKAEKEIPGMDDSPEPKSDEPEDEGDSEKKEWANEPEEEYKDTDYMVNKLSGGMNGPKGTYPKVAGGDNPMQRMESTDLRASIKAELVQRLAETKKR